MMKRIALAAALAFGLMDVQSANAAAGDPAWNWPKSAQSPALQKSINEGGYTPSELRNIRRTLDMLATQGPDRGKYVMPDAKTTRHGFDGLYEIYGGAGFSPASVGDREDHVDDILAKGDRVWVSWMIDGHHTGDLFGWPGTGKPVHVREEAVLVFNKDGMRTDGAYYADDMALYIQGGGKAQFKNPPTAGK